MKKGILILLITGFWLVNITAQEKNKNDYQKHFSAEDLERLEVYEDTLGLLGHLMVNDTMANRRFAAVKEFIIKLKTALKTKNSFHYPFEQIKSVSILSPPDQSFRIFSWQLYVDENHYRYFGAIQMNTEELKLFPLQDRSFEIEETEYEILQPDKWYGALYYNIHQFDSAAGRKYLLFGFDGHSLFQKRKLIDVLSFTDSGPEFGAAVFAKLQEEGRAPITKNRLLLEYSAEVSVKLNYDEFYNMIILDNLITMGSPLPGQGPSNYPDGSYQGYRLENGLWVHVDKVFDQVSDKAPREEPVLDKRKNKNIFGNK